MVLLSEAKAVRILFWDAACSGEFCLLFKESFFELNRKMYKKASGLCGKTYVSFAQFSEQETARCHPERFRRRISSGMRGAKTSEIAICFSSSARLSHKPQERPAKYAAPSAVASVSFVRMT